ncbi:MULTISPECIES: hypothetical protein [Staphylococcus]|uniref:hypothetical protein n=1 Tax=Staphylococcus TaxID=1279 RepID=UPI0008534F08|nr:MULTISPECIES: hypothetical protein [Staphylococcus]MBB2508440.1 hypothetical protein [Staphylococcus cohnii subsp. barensis]MDW4368225.1 hypothetical protein [Staphylococcus saprophyticus]OEK12277.1 hypothetical protein ASS79_03070 [Staphylococcus saprophyticus]
MNTLPLLSFILSIVSIIITCTGLYLTNSRFNRTMLDNLDSKSGWRKTLYEIAGEHTITIKNVQQLRASLRYKEKSYNCTLSPFDTMNIIIIKYCNLLIKNKNHYNDDTTLNFNNSESIRIFCRYLLKDHWEKNHSKYHIYEDKEEELKLCIETLVMFLKLHDMLEHNNEETFKSLFDKANKTIDNAP